MKIILLGAPGSGKGTQSTYLSEKLGVPSISTGDILRDACRKKTPLGLEATEYMNKGQLVPDSLVISIIESRLLQADCQNGYILDGFPRTVAQAQALEHILKQHDEKIDRVVNLDVEESELLRRLSGRRLCQKCGAGYHLLFAPPSQVGLCDHCGGALYQRDDDKEETIKKRLMVYQTSTAPLIQYYQKTGQLVNVIGVGDVKKIFEQIIASVTQS